MTQTPRVVLRSRAREAMIREAAEALPVETGGILLGYRSDNGIVVTDLLVVPSPSATRHRYTRDDVEANVLLKDWFVRHPDEPLIGYVGEWHSHTGIGPASGLDLTSARATAKGAKGPIALVICTPWSLTSFNAFVLRKERLRRVSVQRVRIELPGENVVPAPLSEQVGTVCPISVAYQATDSSESRTVREEQ